MICTPPPFTVLNHSRRCTYEIGHATRTRDGGIGARYTALCVFTSCCNKGEPQLDNTPSTTCCCCTVTSRGIRSAWCVDSRSARTSTAGGASALRRIYLTNREQFDKLATHPESHSHMRFIIHRAQTTGDVKLKPLVNHIVSCMKSVAAATKLTPSSPPSTHAVAAAGTGAMDIDIDVAAAAPSATKTAPFLSIPNCTDLSAEAQHGLLASYVARCMEYRAALVDRLRKECPLTSALRMLDTLLFACVPDATVEELCAELAEHQGATTVHKNVKSINSALRLRFAREAKREKQMAAEHKESTDLQEKLHSVGAGSPDMWRKMLDFKERLEAIAPLEHHPPRISLQEQQSSAAALSTQQSRLYRRLLLQELAAFVTPQQEPLLVFAAPEENHNLLRWRAIVCGSVFDLFVRSWL